MMKIRKAVFPVAGLGTRFLPATKASPKEMLPIVDKPLIQYAAEEAIAAGIDLLVFITGRGKRAIADHFDVSYELEAELKQRQKLDLLDEVRGVLPENIDAVFIRQPMALGLGHAVFMAKSVIGDEPFAVLLADDLIDSAKPCLSQMVDVYNEYGGSVLGVQDVPREQISQYGIVETKENPVTRGLTRIIGIIEKPDPVDAPSTLGVVGRYILSPKIFSYLENTKAGAGGEIQLTDAIAGLLNDEPVYAYEFEGTRYDCGSKLGYLKATVQYALKHKELADDFRAFLKELNT
ncbi:MAG: UTP--glucose-1-phosphate uridylyltransferase GalU [Acidiferrobacterales bacterium]